MRDVESLCAARDSEKLAMRIPIRAQLALLVLFTSFLALAAVSISTVSFARTEDRWKTHTLTRRKTSGSTTTISLSTSSRADPNPLSKIVNVLTYYRSQSLSLTASLKAAQVAASLQLVESSCRTIVTRILLQIGASGILQLKFK